MERALRTHAAGVCDTECDPVALLEFPATMPRPKAHQRHIVTLPCAGLADGSFRPRTIAAENVAADPFDDTDT